MKVLVVYESMWGNTAEVAAAIGRGLGDVPVREVTNVEAADLSDVDLLVVGGPTHAFSMTRESTRQEARKQGASRGTSDRGIRELLSELPNHLSTRVATFDTRVAKVRRLPGSAAKAAAKDLRRRHHADVIAHESYYVEDTAGPLVAGELERASAWGAGLAALTHAG